MPQTFKAIYFADHPGVSPNEKNLTLAFGRKDAELYSRVRGLTSQELRELLGHASFSSLQSEAFEDGLPVNTYCLRLLRQNHRLNGDFDGRDLTNLIEPIQATFRGGQTEPLHAWYPYLEGYSPFFVEQILQEFAPRASVIFDPFCGTGTTALTAARLGKHAYYCELNPLLQYLTKVKVLALTADERKRACMASFLRTYAQQLEDHIRSAAPDRQLESAYTDCFGESRFFDENVYDKILRVRNAVDALACVQPGEAHFVTVAVLSSLIPASRLIRRGDLRYKNESELKREKIEFIASIRYYLTLIADDLERLEPLSLSPSLVCEDARKLINLPKLGIDAVVTSPPYLNGTNYFRNTKVELWFLRCLHTATDLSLFRYKAVTAGINDVTVGKESILEQASIQEIVEKLTVSAYDQRIPRMVSNYFADMRQALSAMKPHLVSGASIVIDIGDSAYGSVHVPTDNLLKELCVSTGFEIEREVPLRKRMSRGGFRLRQVLLVFRFTDEKRTQKGAKRPSQTWTPSWQEFKTRLPHQSGEFSKRNWGHPLHSLCSYQGKMKPSLASHLVSTFLSKGATMLDPFAGVGTIPFEAALQGVKSWAFDISHSALHIAAAKLKRPTRERCECLIRTLESYIRTNHVTESEFASAQSIRFNGSIPQYFHSETLREVLLARRYFRINPPREASDSLVFASLLHILHGNRPYALSRRSHPITPFAPTGEFEYRPLIPRLTDKVDRSLDISYPSDFADGHVLFQDATSWWPQEIDQLEAIITSPPFFDSTRFYLANWMRLWFCGWEASDFKTQPLAFVDERQKVSFEIYDPILRQGRERLKSTGVMVMHLGKSNKCDMAEFLRRLALKWFRKADVFAENVGHCESHGIRDKGRVTSHQYLVLYS